MYLNPFSDFRKHDIVNRILLITGGVSLLLALWDSLISIPFQLPLLAPFFTLSFYGISKLYLWQFFTYPFVISTYGHPIHLFYLISVLIMLYVLWILSRAIYDHAGKKQFLQLYFLSAITAGVLAVFMMALTGTNIHLSGPTAPLLALFTAWTFLYPDVELMLFFVLPARTKWLFAGLVGALFLLPLAQLDLVSFVYYFSAIAIGYLYSTVIWEVGSPFVQTYDFDRFLITRGKWLRDYQGIAPTIETPKIVDIDTGDALQEDDEFVDAMLQKISKQGQSSLSWSERKRLDEISRRKSRD